MVLEEREQLETAKASACVTINSLESGVRSKVSDLAESLAEALELAFAVTDCHQQILESVFRFVTEHLKLKLVGQINEVEKGLATYH
jgi:hypothetical protein